jgi:hypothetical protein
MILEFPMNASRISLICTLILAIAFLVGCSQDGPMTPGTTASLDAVGQDQNGAGEASATLQKVNNTVPFKMKVRNTIELVPPFPPPIINAIFEGAGKSRPFGPFELYSTSQIDVTVFPFGQTAEYVFTFMNGYELYASSAGTSIEDPPGIAVFSGNITFTGGTGFFSNASGSGTYAGTADVGTGLGQFEIDGVISGFGGQGF